MVLIDGVRINPGTIGGAALQNIAPESIERIEIVKGPRSSLYGTDAIGGVVQLFTRGAAKDGASAGATFGSDNTQQVFGDVALTPGEKIEPRLRRQLRGKRRHARVRRRRPRPRLSQCHGPRFSYEYAATDALTPARARVADQRPHGIFLADILGSAVRSRFAGLREQRRIRWKPNTGARKVSACAPR